jgi:cytochrome P450
MAPLPPGPSFALIETFRYMTDPVGAYAYFRKNYGDTLTVRTLEGPLIITGDPEGAREVLSADPMSYEIFAPDNLAMVFREDSVPLLIGDPHRRQRKLLMPQFHGARMKAYAQTMQEVALKRVGQARPGEAFVMHDVARGITREVILRNVFGLTDPTQVAHFEETFVDVQRATTPALLFFKWLRHEFGGLGPYAKYLRANARLDALIAKQLESRRANPDNAPDDMLHMMMTSKYDDGTSMSDERVRAELVGLLVAGYAATATAIAWAVYWTYRAPEILRRLREELAGVPADAGPEAFASLPYLGAVCNETLRIYPPVPDMFRKVRLPIQVRGYTLPAGAGVAVFARMIHSREDLYPEPDEFRPERFLERKFSPYEFIPFGAGVRRCIGSAFAEQQLKVVLATIVRNFDLELTDPKDVPVRQGVGVGPKYGVRVKMVQRLAA